MKITELTNFEIRDKYIQTPGGKFYFFRVIPPNLTILNLQEKKRKIESLKGVLDSNEITMQILAIDKTEDLSSNKTFWKKTPMRYEFIANTILDTISEIEDTGSGIQRAYFFVIAPRDQEQVTLFSNLLTEKGFRFYPVERPELITIMKNFMLRDFLDFDIYTFEQEVARLYEEQTRAKK